jgi:hypothetical protein
MRAEELNRYGCPFYNQTGTVAVQNFAAVIADFPPELREAFERERAARYEEVENFRRSTGGGLGRRYEATNYTN